MQFLAHLYICSEVNVLVRSRRVYVFSYSIAVFLRQVTLPQRFKCLSAENVKYVSDVLILLRPSDMVMQYVA